MRSGFFAFMLLAVLGFVSFTGLKAQKFEDAIEYNDYIVDRQNEIGRKIIEFNEVMADENTSRQDLNPYYDQLLATTQNAVDKVRAMPAWKGNTELRDAAVDLFGFYLDIFQGEYVEMLDIIFADAPTEEGYARVDQIMTDIGVEEKKFDDAFGGAQSAFAKAHGFSLEENELQEKIDGEE